MLPDEHLERLWHDIAGLSDPDGTAPEPNETGELLVSGPT
jgi:hypothetical protein